MTIELSDIILWSLGIALALVVLRILWSWLRLAVLFAAFFTALMLILDRLAGGTALEQIADKLANWIRNKLNF